MSDAQTILAVDDDPNVLDSIELHARQWGFNVRLASTAREMWQILRGEQPNAILLDIQLGDSHGKELLSPLRDAFPHVPVLMITVHSSIPDAVECIKAGAHDYVPKPLDFTRLQIDLGKALEWNHLRRKVHELSTTDRYRFDDIIGGSEPMQRIYRLIESVAPTDATVLILGETGTGKELAARAVHTHSPRSRGPFVAVNAAAIPHELIESQLFGHEKGAFTGANQQHLGYCEQADGGTLFLDEIAEMDFAVQAKLLRFLQDHVVWRIGGRQGRKANVRIVAASNVDPETAVSEKKLRSDLYYRLNVVTVNLPPLRERMGDISLLVRYFLEKASDRHGRNMRQIDPRALEKLEAYPWPGNVRELQNVIERIVVTNSETTLTPRMLPEGMLGGSISESGTIVPMSDDVLDQIIHEATLSDEFPTMLEVEKSLIRRALRAADGSVPEAARTLQISEATIYRKLKKYDLTRTGEDTGNHPALGNGGDASSDVNNA